MREELATIDAIGVNENTMADLLNLANSQQQALERGDFSLLQRLSEERKASFARFVTTPQSAPNSAPSSGSPRLETLARQILEVDRQNLLFLRESSCRVGTELARIHNVRLSFHYIQPSPPPFTHGNIDLNG